MEYSNSSAATANLQSPNHMSVENVQHFGENSNETGVLSPATFSSHYDDKQTYQAYQNQNSSLNQLLQNNQYGPYSNLPFRPPPPSASSNYHTNFRNYENNWNFSRSQAESARMYYSQYQETYPQNSNDVTYSKIDKLKPSDYVMSGDIVQGNSSNYKTDNRSYQNSEIDKSKSNNIQEWKTKNEPISPMDSNNKDIISKTDNEIKSDKQNCIETDCNTSKSDSSANPGFHINTSCSDSVTEKSDIMHNGPNYGFDNKVNPSQIKSQPTTVGYDSSMYSHMMMHPNSPYYSQFRYNNPQQGNNSHNYINQTNNPMMASPIPRPPVMNYPNYIQTSSPGPGYGYAPPIVMHQNRPYNVHSSFVSRGGSQSPFSSNSDIYMNGSLPLQNTGPKELPDRKVEEINTSTSANQDTSSAGSNSNKSVNARSSTASKTKNTPKNESHPATPVSNTVPSPSQTSMSSMVDENEDSVSSLGPNETSMLHHPSISNQSQFNQHQITPPMSQNHSIIYPQPYPNNQVPHTMMSSFPSHLPPQQRPFTPNPNMIPNRQYHHNESQTNNSCYQKLMELGNEPERGPWIERYLRFMQENNTPLSAVPTVVKQPLDLFRLYHAVRERGGLLNVVKTKRWKEICLIVNVNASASGAYTLRRNYIKCLLDYECKFDRNSADPGPILQEIQSLSDKKKKSTSRNAGSSPSSTISSGQTSQHNSEYGSTSSTPRPTIPHPDFNTPHPFHGHNPYNNVIHNGSMMHRSPIHYPAQRGHNPYPGPYTGPRMMGFNSPVNPMHPHARYDANIPPNWNKSMVMNQQQWSSPGSSSSSNSTHPMQMPMSPGTPTNSISNISQQSQPAGDNFDINSKDVSKLESNAARFTNSESNTKHLDNFSDKDVDKIEMVSKSDSANYYNNPYIEYSGQEISCDYKNLANNSTSQFYPPMQQYPCFTYSRQYSSTFRQAAPNSLSFSSYYPPNPNYIYPPSGAVSHSSNMMNNSHHVTNSVSSHSTSPYYSIGSIQEHSRRMDWKSNYGGMPPPPPPPPNVQSTSRPNLPNTSQIGPGSHSQYHSTLPHGSNYVNQPPGPFNQQRQINPQLPSNLMPLNRNVLQTTNSNLSDQMNYINKSMGPSSSSAIANSIHSMSPATCHNRSQIESSRLNTSYPSQITYSKSSSHFIKRYDSLFPPNSVEATQPDYSKKRKYSSKDIKVFNPTTVTMALKSGLVTEISWALNYLNIWSRDDTFFEKLNLKNLMPMFQALIDVWRNSLGSIFGRDIFIKDLELPVILDESITNKADIKNLFSKIETVLKNRQLKLEKEICKNGIIESEDDTKLAQDKILDLLHGVKYSVNRRGLTVKLDYNSKLEFAINGDSELAEFIIKTCSNSPKTENDSNNNIDYSDDKLSKCKLNSLNDLWLIGGSDSTYHILPPILSQNKNTNNEWYSRLRCIDSHPQESADNSFGPPEIKRSRCTSPHSPSSSNPPNLEHENHIGDLKFEETIEDIDFFRLQAKSEIINDGESLFFKIIESDEEKMMRCISVSNSIRNLSFLSGNDRIIGSNRTILVILGRLLLLGHEHSMDEWPPSNQEKECWWLKWIDDIREHVLVTLVNISSYLELSKHHEIIVRPIVTGLLHWLTCNSAAAEDSLPSHRVLGCRRLALECMMRLCVHEKNIDFILSTTNKGSDQIIQELFNYLAASFCYPDVQVVKEMSLAVMHYLSLGGENGIGCIYLANAQPNIISGLISFIEITESQIRHVVDNMGMEALQARPELMGTSLEFLRHSGALLNRIASYEINRKHFSRDHEIRMLNLVISTVLDQTVAQSISGVLYLLCNHDENQSNPETCNKFKSFLTFNDLSFCEKDNSVSVLPENETATSYAN